VRGGLGSGYSENDAHRDTALKGIGKFRMPSHFSLLPCLGKLASQIEPWADTVKDVVLKARKTSLLERRKLVSI